MSKAESKYKIWLAKQPFCWGYPRCDGDLVATDHEPDCPMNNKEPTSLRDAYLAGFQDACETILAT